MSILSSLCMTAACPALRGPSRDWEFSDDIWLGSVLGGMFSEFSVLLLSQLILNLVTLQIVTQFKSTSYYCDRTLG